jgi:hypothetical protein
VYFCDCSEARSLDGLCFVVASVLAITARVATIPRDSSDMRSPAAAVAC